MTTSKNYVFSAREFMIVSDFFADYVNLVHTQRTLKEHKRFISRNFDTIKFINYGILYGKISEKQFLEISKIDNLKDNDIELYSEKLERIFSD
jgi:hypothetical protein